MMEQIGRRDALKIAAVGMAAALQAAENKYAVKSSHPPFQGLKVGFTSYSTRKLTLPQTLAEAQRLGVKYISIKDVHCPLTATLAERQAVRKQIADAGIQLMGVGVITLPSEEKAIRAALEYARDLGSPAAVVMLDPPAVPTLDRVVKDFDLRVAIHNHGPEDKRFPSPFGIFKAIQNVDRKIGVCVDVGHTFRLGEDPVQALRTCAPRLYDMHIKDLAGPEFPARNVPVGTGVLDIVGIVKALRDIRYTHQVALEYEAEPDAPVPGMAESFGFLRGVLAAG